MTMFRWLGKSIKKLESAFMVLVTPMTDSDIGNPFRAVFGEDVVLPGGSAIEQKTLFYDASAEELCEHAHITDNVLIEATRVHARRFRTRSRLLNIILSIVYVFIIALFVSAYFYFLSPYVIPILSASLFLTFFAVILVLIIGFILGTVAIRIGARIATLLINTYFADSACAIYILHLLIDLNKDTLLTPTRKGNLMRRMDHLADMTRLVPVTFGVQYKENQEWSRRHFAEMELYIWERKRWLMAPQSATLTQLRHDFRQLMPIYVSGNYGNFIWENLVKPEPEKPKLRWWQRIAARLPRFFGVVLPLVLMGLYIWRPHLFPFITLAPDMVTIVFVAWLLLSIDALLNLGIVAALTNVAKGIKELK